MKNKNKKDTKGALICSMLALVLCCAMLIGTTFAWFTDSVTSGRNKIVAGNLDVELYAKDPASGDYTPVTVDSNLFMEDALWEPGHVEYINLKVANLGTLALKYQLSVNVASETGSINKDDVAFKLSDYIKFAVIEGEKTYASDDAGRQAAIGDAEAAGSTWISALNVNDNGVLYPAGKSTDSIPSEEYVTLVVYMPTSVGNEANHKTGEAAPEISLGVNLVATQTPYEEDSFGPDYDVNAVYPVLPDLIDTTASGNITVADGGTLGDSSAGAQIVVPANAVTEDTDAIFSMVLTESKPDSVTYEISLKDADGNDVALSQKATVTANIGTDLLNVKVAHNGEAMDESDYSYDRTTGVLTIQTTSFSPFTITYEFDTVATVDGVAYPSINAAVSAAESGDTVVVQDDYTSSSMVINLVSETDKAITVDLNGNTLTYEGNGDRAVQVAYEGAKLTVKNGTINMSGSASDMYGIIALYGPEVTLEDVTINSEGEGVVANTSTTLKMERVNVTANGIGVWSAGTNNDIYIDNCEINSHYNSIYHNGSTAPCSIVVKNSKLTDTLSNAVYISNSSGRELQTLVIDNCIIRGATAVEVKHTDATITNSILTATEEKASREYGNGVCTQGYGFAVTSNGANDKITGTVSVTNCKLYNTTEDGYVEGGTPNGAYFVFTPSDGASVIVDGTAVSSFNLYGEESAEETP